jgi:eukaryotic-like serine/threonine-protein kinase
VGSSISTMLSPTGASDSTSLTDDPLSGQPYRALRLLGTGAMGEVFLAEHRELATPCVVKVQHARLARDPNIADRIRLEAESLARLSHPNIVAILGSGQTTDERPFIVMEYLHGQTMADELAARGQLPMLEALDFACQLLRGLAAAHALGIVHRDIKPDNLFLCDGPRGNRLLKLLDFGVACTTPSALLGGPSPLAVPTATGSVVGALRYVSPEGALAQRVDHRADLYSAALVLYFALAGRGPFDHIRSALLLLSAHVAEQPEPPSRFSTSAIPAELDRAVLRALHKAPGERFQSADDLREELERIMNQLRRSPDASEIRRLPEAARRNPDSSGPWVRTTSAAEPSHTPSEQSGPLRAGERFLDKYEIVRQIGRGGQASVYLGRHIFTAREVAIKVIHSSRGMTQETLERGKAEARALGRLDHPNIVVMHDAGVTDDGLFYIVMELLRGRSLRSALTAHGRFDIEEALALVSSAAEALQAAHEMDLIHRDLTPDNIYLTRNNRVKVLDFGIAKVLNEFGFTTHKDIVMGSILYMSPEQVQGLPLDARSDICALGLLMFEMLFGKHPSLLLFEHNLRDRHEVQRRPTLAEIPPIQMNQTPPLLSELDPNIPPHLAQIVSRAIAKDPQDRFSTMRDFAAAIRVCHETYVKETPLTLRQSATRDLSLHMDGESEEDPPASQRATPKRGLVWDGAGSLTPAPGHGDLFETITATTGAMPNLDGNSTSRRALGNNRTRASARAGLVAVCLFSAALGSLGALRHFDAESASPPGADRRLVAASALSATSVVASLSPALPTATPGREHAPPEQPKYALSTVLDQAPPVTSPPVAPAPIRRSATSTARITRTATPAAVTAPEVPAEPMIDVSRPLQIALGSKPSKPSSSTREEPRKKLNGGKLIYGD